MQMSTLQARFQSCGHETASTALMANPNKAGHHSSLDQSGMLSDPDFIMKDVYIIQILECRMWEKSEYMLSHSETILLPIAEQNCNIKWANKFFENVAKLKYLGMIITNQNMFHEEIKIRLNSGSAFYHSVQNLMSSPLLSKIVYIKIYINIILLVSCETWSLT
jgi:hypothetical protein